VTEYGAHYAEVGVFRSGPASTVFSGWNYLEPWQLWQSLVGEWGTLCEEGQCSEGGVSCFCGTCDVLCEIDLCLGLDRSY